MFSVPTWVSLKLHLKGRTSTRKKTAPSLARCSSWLISWAALCLNDRLPLGPPALHTQPRVSDPHCEGGRETAVRGCVAGSWACTFSTPLTLCLKSRFLQMKQLHVLSQLTLKTKTLLSFLNTYEKKRLFFNFQKRPMNSFGVQIQPSRISLKLFPWVLFCSWDQASFFF